MTFLDLHVFAFTSLMSDSATLSTLNAFYFLTVKDNIMFNPIFWNAQLESDPKHTRHARISLMDIELIAIKIYQIAESGNIVSYSSRFQVLNRFAASPLQQLDRQPCMASECRELPNHEPCHHDLTHNSVILSNNALLDLLPRNFTLHFYLFEE